MILDERTRSINGQFAFKEASEGEKEETSRQTVHEGNALEQYGSHEDSGNDKESSKFILNTVLGRCNQLFNRVDLQS